MNWLAQIIDAAERGLSEYKELESQLIQLSGYRLKTVVTLLAAGYTLEPPKYELTSMAELGERGGDLHG